MPLSEAASNASSFFAQFQADSLVLTNKAIESREQRENISGDIARLQSAYDALLVPTTDRTEEQLDIAKEACDEQRHAAAGAIRAWVKDLREHFFESDANTPVENERIATVLRGSVKALERWNGKMDKILVFDPAATVYPNLTRESLIPAVRPKAHRMKSRSDGPVDSPTDLANLTPTQKWRMLRREQ